MESTYILMGKTISLPDPEEAGVIKKYKRLRIYEVSKNFLFSSQKFGWGTEIRADTIKDFEISIAEYA